MVAETGLARKGTGGRKPPKRRTEILEAAAQMFYERGYDATSTQDIADAVGLLKGSLYYYIDSKEDFLFEIINAQNDAILEVADRMRLSEGSALSKLEKLIEAHVDLFTRNLVQSVVYLRDARLLTGERKSTIDSGARAYLEALRTILRLGQEEGDIDPKLDVRTAAFGIIGLLNSLAGWFDPSGPMVASSLARENAALLVTGVATQKALDDAGDVGALRDKIRAASKPKAKRAS